MLLTLSVRSFLSRWPHTIIMCWHCFLQEVRKSPCEPRGSLRVTWFVKIINQVKFPPSNVAPNDSHGTGPEVTSHCKCQELREQQHCHGCSRSQ